MIKFRLNFRSDIFNVVVSDNRYTVIRGDSARGKSFLLDVVDTVSKLERNFSIAGFRLYAAFSADKAAEYLQSFPPVIVFIDEDDAAIFAYKYAKNIVWGRNNHLVILSREDFIWLPYGVADSFIMERKGNVHNIVPLFESVADSNI